MTLLLQQTHQNTEMPYLIPKTTASVPETSALKFAVIENVKRASNHSRRKCK